MPSGDDCGTGMQNALLPQLRCIGYGYNWGPNSSYRLGLISERIRWDTATNSNNYIEAGVALAAITSPADMFSYGDTGDSPRYTLCDDYIFQYYTTTTKSSATRHGGRLNMAFVDGHAKSIPWKIDLVHESAIRAGAIGVSGIGRHGGAQRPELGKYGTSRSGRRSQAPVGLRPRLIGPSPEAGEARQQCVNAE